MTDHPIPIPSLWGRTGSGCKGPCEQGRTICPMPDHCYPYVPVHVMDLHQQPEPELARLQPEAPREQPAIRFAPGVIQAYRPTLLQRIKLGLLELWDNFGGMA